MKNQLKCLIAAGLIGLLGCQEKGPVEKAGERVDEVIDNVKHGDAPLKQKGAAEKVGESIDDSIKKLEKN